MSSSWCVVRRWSLAARIGAVSLVVPAGAASAAPTGTPVFASSSFAARSASPSPAIAAVRPARAADDASPPDLTRGGTKNGVPDWNLGATGASGWIFARDFDTSEARQILIGAVAEGSPAYGVLRPGDVIVGSGGVPFDTDARRALAEAIADAESSPAGDPARAARLALLVWRAGETLELSVPLAPMPAYAATAPWDCGKSRAILQAGCAAIARRGFPGGGIDAPVRGGNWDPDLLNSVNALALLAVGDPQYDALVRDYARRVGPKDLDLVLREGLYAWTWGYAQLFLTEYFLATRDAEVLPAIREYAHKIAIGQSEVGTWGHGFRVEGNNGTLGGYGAINQCGLVCWISLILAEKCGVDDPAVRAAIARSHEFFGFYVGKGSVPYGDHPPYWLHDDNGKSAAAAVAFDLMGDERGARFFSRMATAAYGEKELGHTGNFLGLLWGALGANRAGPAAAAAFLGEQRWFLDLARRWDGGFFTNSRDNYGWDMTGIFVLHHALPLRRLMITGRGMDDSDALRVDELARVLASGRGFPLGRRDARFADMDEQGLVAALSDWSPSVRVRAARALGARKQSSDADDALVRTLVAMLGSDRREKDLETSRERNLHAKLGACVALEHLEERAAPAVDALIAQLSADDMWLRIRAAFALSQIGRPAMKAVPEMLRMAAREDPRDPRGIEAKYLSFALFRADFVDQVPPRPGLVAGSLEGVDRSLALPVIARMLACDDGLGTVSVRSVFRTLGDDELRAMLPSIVAAAGTTPPSGEMFAQEIRVEALRYMAERRIVEGLPVFIEYARTQNGWGSRTREILPLLEKYGGEARRVLPELRELRRSWAEDDARRNEPSTERTKAQVAEDVIRAIETAG